MSFVRNLTVCCVRVAPRCCRAGHGTAVDWWSSGHADVRDADGAGTLSHALCKKCNFGAGLTLSLCVQPPFYSQNINLMYEKILQAELSFPPYVSQEARSLLMGVRI